MPKNYENLVVEEADLTFRGALIGWTVTNVLMSSTSYGGDVDMGHIKDQNSANGSKT